MWQMWRDVQNLLITFLTAEECYMVLKRLGQKLIETPSNPLNADAMMVLPNMDLNYGDQGKLKHYWDCILVGFLKRCP